ncbi:RHS repeat domain-containing protein, partial [Flavobacterium polysaccharolyticum]
KRYELSNHLGNVLSVISDRSLVGANNTLTPDVLSYSDYYPFGSLVPNRHGSSGSYRYGFQGQEKDDELKGEGNSLNYTFRMHDPRVGRFFAVDPLASEFPHLTPYQFASNSPIVLKEIEGKEGEIYILDLKKTSPVLKLIERKDFKWWPDAIEPDYKTVIVKGANNSELKLTFTYYGSTGAFHNGEFGDGPNILDWNKFEENPVAALASGKYVAEDEIKGSLIRDLAMMVVFHRIITSGTKGKAIVNEGNGGNGVSFRNFSGLPGKSGMKLEGRLSAEAMKELTNRFGVEFAQVYKLGKGKNGSGGTYYLYSGNANSVNIQGILDGKSILINHTHPAGSSIASKADLKLLENIENSGSPQRSSEIIPIGKKETSRFNKSGENTTDKNRRLKN